MYLLFKATTKLQELPKHSWKYVGIDTVQHRKYSVPEMAVYGVPVYTVERTKEGGWAGREKEVQAGPRLCTGAEGGPGGCPGGSGSFLRAATWKNGGAPYST